MYVPCHVSIEGNATVALLAKSAEVPSPIYLPNVNNIKQLSYEPNSTAGKTFGIRKPKKQTLSS